MKKLKVNIIGCGNIFPMHAESIRQFTDDIAYLSAVCDIKKERAKKAGKKYNCRYYFNYKDMLIKEKPDIVHICTPHYLHSEMSIFAAENNIHIFQEKPLGLNADDAYKIYKKIKNSKIKFAICFQNRYNPSSQLAKKLISSGQMGKIYSAKLILTWHKPDEYYLKSDWKGTFEKEGGGVVIDQAIHSFDILNWLFESEIDYIYCNTANRLHKIVKVEDEAAGVIVYKNNSYINFYTISHYSYDDDVLMEIHCEKGRIKIIKDSASALFYKTNKVMEAKPNPKDYIDYGNGVKDYWGVCHSIEIREFYEAVLKDKPVAVNIDEGFKTQLIVEGIYKSARFNKLFKFKNLLNKYKIKY